jgi:thiamine-phosphate pyrophosphorylase
MNSGVLRIVDANANRAREALRTMEDVARFVLNDGQLSEELKRARHELRAALESAGATAETLLAYRDTPGDVGTGITTRQERARADVREAAVAAGKRAGEALRVLEESVKMIARPGNAGSDGLVKALRYRVYELERRLIAALGTGRGKQWRLCVLITASLCTHHSWEEVAKRAIEGGADCLQLREKEIDSRELLERARMMVHICRGGGAASVINDRVDIALLAGADGVHVGQSDLRVADVRRLAGDSLLVGVSTSNMDQARAAVCEGADVCGVGPMFATTTKHKPVLSGPAYLRAYTSDELTARVAHLAIGGITSANVGELVRAGGRGVAVSSAVCGASDPRKACEDILRAMDLALADAAAAANPE